MEHGPTGTSAQVDPKGGRVAATMRRRTERQERTPPEIDDSTLQATLNQVLNRRPLVGLAVGVIREGRLELFRGHGLADIASSRPVTEDTVLRIASITKTVTAVAVMQLVEQGLVELDTPANEYLRAFKLIPARAVHRPATVRHLLTHTAGTPEVVHAWQALLPDFGESVRVGQPLPSLAEFYRGGLRLEAEPGTRFVYGNHGPATLGQIVEDVSGKPLHRYFREHIFEPLGMTSTDLQRSASVTARLATGYRLGSRAATPVAEREMITAGAASIYSSPRDMARYVAALLGGGANEHGTVLGARTLASMFEPHHQPDPRLPGMGLGFFRADLAGHLAVEHQGMHPGFDSQLLLAPDDRVGVMAFTNGARNAALWLPAETGRLLRQVLGLPADAIRADIPQRPEVWGEICGWYQLAARVTDVRLRSMLGAGIEILARADHLALRYLSPIPALYRGFPLYPDDEADPYAFRMDLSEFGMGTSRVVFSRTPGGGTSLHLGLMPLSLQRQAAWRNPRSWAVGSLGALAVTAGAVAARRRRAPASRRRSRP